MGKGCNGTDSGTKEEISELPPDLGKCPKDEETQMDNKLKRLF